MIDIQLPLHGHKRLWIVEIRDAATGDSVSLPPSDDWHKTVHCVNVLADIYGRHNVSLYQWDVTNIWVDAG